MSKIRGQAPVIAATVVYLVGVVGGTVWAGRAGYTYTTGDARLTVQRARGGWVIVGHIARPGTTGQGRQLRRLLAGPLLTTADANQITITLTTDSPTLADIYAHDFPGLVQTRVSRFGVIHMTRPPQLGHFDT